MRQPTPPTVGFAALLTVLLLAGAPRAQRTWIVDAANGAGADFTDLPPAVAAAIDGDRILVRAGSYSGTVLAETLTVLGEGQVTLASLSVSGLTASEVVVVAGIRTNTLSVAGNDGRVHFENFSGLAFLGLSQRIDDTRLFTCNDSTFRDGLYVSDSSVLLSGCSVSTPLPTRFGLSIGGTSQVTISGGDVRGFDEQCRLVYDPPGEAILIQDGSVLVVTGDGAVVTAGRDDPSCPQPESVPAIRAFDATIHRDPGVTIAGNGAPPIEGTFLLIDERLPAVAASGAPPGGLIHSDVYAPAGSLSALLISVSSFDLPTPFGRLWLAPANFLIDAGVLDQSEHRAHALATGATWLRGLSVTLQAATLPPSGGLRLSEPVIVVLD